jgi:hypothetical protein
MSITVQKEIYMSRLSKVLLVFVVVVFALACNMVTEPIRDAQDLAQTAQALGTAIPVETLQALASAIPAETLQALPSAIPTLQALASSIPDFGSMLDPQGIPVKEWRGIPIKPQATAGQEFPENNTYSFKAQVTSQEVQDFYTQQLTALGWTQSFPGIVQAEGGILVFQKEESGLTVTITVTEGTAVIILTLG